ncbi:MAG: elongation factor P [Mycoplasma sp.]|nr:elongation factor P [Mycoplasma sp.]
MISVNNFKPNITFLDNNEIYVVIEAQHSKQARGQATVKVKVKNLRTGAINIKTYTGGDKVEPAFVERKKMAYLYKDDSSIYLMDNQTYEQISIDLKKVEWELNFLTENTIIEIRTFNNEILDIVLPINIPLKVIEAQDAVKGNSQSNPQKKVTIETGFILEAPLFIKQGDTIIVSSENGKYVSRA